MKNYAVVFPGFGAVHSGMGKSFADSAPAMQVYKELSEVFGFDVAELSFKGKASELSLPNKAFLLGFAHSMAINAEIKDKLPAPSAYAGYSGGEITAFTAAGAFSLKDGALAAQMYSDMHADALKAGELECWRLTNTKSEFVELVTNKMMDAYVQITAIEAPEQTVIVGDREGIQKTMDELCGKHDAKAEKLADAPALHSMMMFPYVIKMQGKMKELPVTKELATPIYSNLYGGKIETLGSPADYFCSQQMESIKLSKEAKAMVTDGIELLVVAGADKALVNALKCAAPDIECVLCEDMKSIEKLIK